MKKIRIYKFQEKIQDVYGMDADAALYTAGKIMYDLPKKLLPNIDEWCSGRKLSEITIEGFSIPLILDLWQSNDFISAVNCMIELDKDPDNGKRKVWRMQR